MNLTIQSLNDIMNSDFKLWEQAQTELDGTAITKTVTLPYDIGEFSITFEGVKDAKGRRNAAAIWGQSVRDVVEEKIGDEAVSARARQAGPRAGEGTSDIIVTGSGRPAEAVPSAPAAEAHVEAVFMGGVGAANRARELHRELFEVLGRTGEIQRELAALDAYLEVVNAQEIQTETATVEDGEGEVEAESAPVKSSDAIL